MHYCTENNEGRVNLEKRVISGDFRTSIIFAVTEYRKRQTIVGAYGGMLPRENFATNTSKIMILNPTPRIQRSYKDAQRPTAVEAARRAVRGKQFFSCKVKNLRKDWCVYEISFSKTAYLREIRKLFSCSDSQKYVTDILTFQANFLRLNYRFRILWPESVGFSNYTTWAPHK